MRVLVTGATGFVGRVLCPQLERQGYLVRAALRQDQLLPAGVREKVVIGEICARTDWTTALEGVDMVVHTAGRAHVVEPVREDADLYMSVNAYGTEHLAECAAGAKVRRFVYLSSIKVNGDHSGSRPFTETDAPDPKDVYGESKRLGEECLRAVSRATGMEVAIIRPPLVYGPGVRANFLALLKAVDRHRIFPFGLVRNRRSFISVWNLCDVLLLLLSHPDAAGTWMVSDGEYPSTPQLVERIGRALGKRVINLPVPVGLLALLAYLAGRKSLMSRLCDSFEVDITAISRDLNWTPPVKMDEALRRTVSWYCSRG